MSRWRTEGDSVLVRRAGRRHRRRQARGVVRGALLLVIGTGIGACGAQPGAQSSATSTSAVGHGPSAASCTSAEIHAAVGRQLAPGTAGVSGVIVLTETGSTPCSLQGYLGIGLPARGSRVLAISVAHDGRLSAHGFESGHAPTRPAKVVL